MRNVPADRILALQEENQLGLSVPGVRAPAVIDGYFWTGTKEEAFASHQASDVPIIASSNGDDLDFGANPLTRARTVADYQAIARQMYGRRSRRSSCSFTRRRPTPTSSRWRIAPPWKTA